MAEEFKARAYQAEAISFILGRPFSGLIMRPGLGKTSCVCVARLVLRKKKLARRALVVAPYNVASMVWHEEIAKWGFDLKIGFAHGSKFEETIKDKKLDIVTMTCDGLARLYATFTPKDIYKLFDHLIVDESTKFKHINSQRFRLLRPYLSHFARRTVLTGTPSPNGYGDLFGQAYITDRGERLGQWKKRYELEYFDKVGFGGYTTVLKKGADKKIQKQLKDIWMFIDDEALGLRRYQVNVIKVELPDKAVRAYTTLRRESVLTLKGKRLNAVNAAVLSNKLRQVSSGEAYGIDKKLLKIHDVKLTALLDLVEQMQGNPLIVGYEFDHERDRIAKALDQVPLTISGKTSKAQRKKILAEFNTGAHPVLLAQSATIAHGLNLQKVCHTVCFYTLPWDLEIFEQFIKRVHRLGQTKRVIAHALIAQGTIDEGVLKVLLSKDRSQRALMAALALHIQPEEKDDVNIVRGRGKLSREVRRAHRPQRHGAATRRVSKRRRDRVPAKVPRRGAR